MAKIYAVIGTKGGTGKTSTTVNLGSILADMGKSVLLIDTDFAQALSKYFNIPFPADAGLTQLITRADPAGCISQTGFPRLDLILNDDSLGDKGGPVLSFLRQSSSHMIYLSLALQKLAEAYDYMFIDTQGASGLVQEAAILAADELISPVVPNYLDSTEFITGTVGLLRKLLPAPGMKTTIAGKPLAPCNVVINKMGRTRDAKNVVDHLRKEFDQAGDGLVRVLNTVIPDLAVYNKAAGASEAAHHFEPTRPTYSPSAKETMVNLAYELQPKLTGTVPAWEV